MNHKKILVFILGIIIYLSSIQPSFAQEAQYAPGEIIVKYKEGNTPEELKADVQERNTKRKTFVGRMQVAFENVTLQLQGEKPPEDKLAQVESIEKKVQVKEKKEVFKKEVTDKVAENNLKNIELIKTEAKIPVKEMEKLYDALPTIEYARPNYINSFFAIPNDPLYSSEWGLAKIQMPQAWDITKGSSSIKVAVIDTGIEYYHSDLNGRVTLGYDYYYNDTDPDDYAGHGTHVAGTIGALTNNSIGVSGVNWNIQLMALKVFPDGPGGAFDSDITAAIADAAYNGAKVINLSLGSQYQCDSYYQSVINYARNLGATVVVAAGNSNLNASGLTPAGCSGVITVGATTTTDSRATYSNYGSVVDIAAPGGQGNPSCSSSNCILSTYINGSYASIAGTSMAAPHVAGVAALMLAINPNLTPDQVESLIKNNGDTISTDQPIGGKRLNAHKTLLALLPPTNTPTPLPTVTPTRTPTPTAPNTPTPTRTPTPTPTYTPTPIPPTATPTPIPTNTPTPTPIPPTPTPTVTLTPTPTRTPTPQPTSTPTITPTPTPTYSPADFNRDGLVSILDFNIWRCEFLGNGVCQNPASNKSADANNDNLVTLLDFGMWLNIFRSIY